MCGIVLLMWHLRKHITWSRKTVDDESAGESCKDKGVRTTNKTYTENARSVLRYCSFKTHNGIKYKKI
jgi:hypothetical protein